MKFEESLDRLEKLVSKMESGQLKLEEMLAAFEEGRKLVTECRDELKSVQLKIEKVTGS